MAQNLTDAEILAKYGLVDPLLDALLFARQVDGLALKRRAHLSLDISWKGGNEVNLRYKIYGYDSEGRELQTSADSGKGVLASCIRELNSRYAKRMNDR